MTYYEKFVAVVKCNNSILREKEGIVTLPFNSEYTILLKNLNSKDALVEITIDGEDVLNGRSLIIRKNSSSEVSGFMKKNKFKNRFKFIQKTRDNIASGEITDEIDDGIISIKFTFTKDVPEEITQIFKKKVHVDHYDNYYNWPVWRRRIPYYPYPIFDSDTVYGETLLNINNTKTFSSSNNNNFISRSADFSQVNLDLEPIPNEDEGKTVMGSKINEKLVDGFIGDLEKNSHIIVLRLRGIIKKEQQELELGGDITYIKTITTTKEKKYCQNCGKANKSNFNYCSKCGTKL